MDYLKEIAERNKTVFHLVGRVGGDRLIINDLIDYNVEEMNQKWRNAIEERL